MRFFRIPDLPKMDVALLVTRTDDSHISDAITNFISSWGDAQRCLLRSVCRKDAVIATSRGYDGVFTGMEREQTRGRERNPRPIARVGIASGQKEFLLDPLYGFTRMVSGEKIELVARCNHRCYTKRKSMFSGP